MMDPLATRLAKLQVSRGGRATRGRGRGSGRGEQTHAVRSPSGLRTPVSGLQTPLSGLTTPSSGVSTPAEESELDSEEDSAEEEEVVRQPFRFFDLPYELRRKILHMVMHYSDVVDLNVNAVRRVSMMPASRQFYHECREAFYGGNVFRLLPLDGPVHKKRTKPLIQHFASRNRALITRLELRLGPHWKDPPRCWQIDDKLGLEDLHLLRRLDILVQCDPEHPSFAGFRRSKEFYTMFCGDLLNEILQRAPRLDIVAIDSWPAVGRDSPLVRRLEYETTAAAKKVLWGANLQPETCYDVLIHSAGVKSVYDIVDLRSFVMTE